MEAFEGALIKLIAKYRGKASWHEIIRGLEEQTVECKRERDGLESRILKGDEFDPADPHHLRATSGLV